MKFGFIKCGAYTPKIKVADIEFNTQNIINGINEAEKQNVELLVFPELSITGYTCGDLFYSDVLLNGAIKSLDKIKKVTQDKKMIVFIGLPIKINNLLYNSAVAISNGKILGVIPKTFLPNYNEFYEKRHFSSATDNLQYIEINGEKIPFSKNIIFRDKDNFDFSVACEICEDVWTPIPPSIYHAINGANIIVNLSCSDEVIGKKEYRDSLIQNHSAKIVAGYVYADAGDGESTTDMIFSGHNLICENGKILKESDLFSTGLITSEIDVSFISFERSKIFNQNFEMKKDYLIVSFSANKENENLTREYSKTPFVPQSKNELDIRTSLILNMQSEGLKKRIEHTHAKSVVLGLSGGLDSTLAILVAVTAMEKLGRSRKDVIAVTMPCFGTTSRTYENTIRLSKSLGTTLKKVDISKQVTRHLKDIKHQNDVYDVTFENAQARSRTLVLMDIANMENGLVIGTGDLSELALGWATYNGDHMSMYGVNCSIPKTLVRYIVKYYAGISKGKLKATLLDILNTPVSPELLPAQNDQISQKTEDLVGPYILHDFFMYNMLRLGFSPKKIYYLAVKTFAGEFDKETILKWLKTFIRRFFNQQFKRSCIPDGVKVGTVTLSPRGDWRMPSDAVALLWLNELENL